MSERAPTFPPLFHGQPVTGGIAPFAKACAQATLGCDAGLLTYNINLGMLRAAIVFAPETPLAQAMSIFPCCAIGFQNAFGALAPPEVAVHLKWQGGVMVNGANCGRLRVAASTDDPTVEPGWIVVGLDLPLIPQSDGAPGNTPDQTSLFEEGCVEVDPVLLLEAWSRHTLVWINRLADEGPAPLHAEWRGLAFAMGENVDFELSGTRYRGHFLGVDENFGMLLRTGEKTSLLPLTLCLEKGENQ